MHVTYTDNINKSSVSKFIAINIVNYIATTILLCIHTVGIVAKELSLAGHRGKLMA